MYLNYEIMNTKIKIMYRIPFEVEINILIISYTVN